jgi:hypothetical protein
MAVIDLRVGKNFYLSAVPHLERLHPQVFAEAFNMMNHQNITAANRRHTASAISPARRQRYNSRRFSGDSIRVLYVSS